MTWWSIVVWCQHKLVFLWYNLKTLAAVVYSQINVTSVTMPYLLCYVLTSATFDLIDTRFEIHSDLTHTGLWALVYLVLDKSKPSITQSNPESCCLSWDLKCSLIEISKGLNQVDQHIVCHGISSKSLLCLKMWLALCILLLHIRLNLTEQLVRNCGREMPRRWEAMTEIVCGSCGCVIIQTHSVIQKPS